MVGDAVIISVAILIAIFLDFVFLKYHFNLIMDVMKQIRDTGQE